MKTSPIANYGSIANTTVNPVPSEIGSINAEPAASHAESDINANPLAASAGDPPAETRSLLHRSVSASEVNQIPKRPDNIFRPLSDSVKLIKNLADKKIFPQDMDKNFIISNDADNLLKRISEAKNRNPIFDTSDQENLKILSDACDLAIEASKYIKDAKPSLYMGLLVANVIVSIGTLGGGIVLATLAPAILNNSEPALQAGAWIGAGAAAVFGLYTGIDSVRDTHNQYDQLKTAKKKLSEFNQILGRFRQQQLGHIPPGEEGLHSNVNDPMSDWQSLASTWKFIGYAINQDVFTANVAKKIEISSKIDNLMESIEFIRSQPGIEGDLEEGVNINPPINLIRNVIDPDLEKILFESNSIAIELLGMLGNTASYRLGAASATLRIGFSSVAAISAVIAAALSPHLVDIANPKPAHTEPLKGGAVGGLVAVVLGQARDIVLKSKKLLDLTKNKRLVERKLEAIIAEDRQSPGFKRRLKEYRLGNIGRGPYEENATTVVPQGAPGIPVQQTTYQTGTGSGNERDLASGMHGDELV